MTTPSRIPGITGLDIPPLSMTREQAQNIAPSYFRLTSSSGASTKCPVCGDDTVELYLTFIPNRKPPELSCANWDCLDPDWLKNATDCGILIEDKLAKLVASW